jgi:hypothetical protein
MAAEAVRAAVFFEDEEERKLAEEALAARPGEAVVFNGVVEGWATPADLEGLSRRGLVVEALGEHAAPPPVDAAAASGEPPAEPAPQLLADFKEQADLAEPPAPLAEEVYHLDLRGPITQEQRLELDSFGVDITAFEPPDRYRTFLTPEQLEKVKELPYVAEVNRYRFEETVTPELLDAVSRAPEGGGASLLADPGAPDVRRFDALLHRSSDLKKICALIEDAQNTEVLDTSNLRVRFEAPAAAAFLAGLAALPEVRKLAPFEPPKLL